MKRELPVWLEAVPRDESRSDGECGVLQVRGYAIVWNSPSERMGRVVETIDPRALDHLGDLNALDVRMQGEHEGLALARTSNGTLRLVKDQHGLQIEADLDGRRGDARDLYYATERGDVSQMSFGFRIAKNGETISELEDGTIRAHVTKIERLYEVSGVTFPAYSDTELEVVPVADMDEPSEDGEPEPVERVFDYSLYRARTRRER